MQDMRVLPLLAVAFASAAAPCPEVKAEPAPEGSRIHIQNTAAHPITAFVIEIVDYPGNQFAYRKDELFGAAIAPASERIITVGTLMPGTVPDYLKMTGAVFANGDICGDSQKVKPILDLRRENLKLSRDLISRVEKAKAAQQAPDKLAAELVESARSAKEGPSGVINHIASFLKRGSYDDVLAALRTTEQILAASKPVL